MENLWLAIAGCSFGKDIPCQCGTSVRPVQRRSCSRERTSMRAAYKVLRRVILPLGLIGSSIILLGCQQHSSSKPALPAVQPSSIGVDIQPSGVVALTTNTAEFRILPSGRIQAFLVEGGKKLSLDDADRHNPGSGHFLIADGKSIDFISDNTQARVLDAGGKLGRGR